MATAGTTTALCKQSARFHVDLHPCHSNAVLDGVQSVLNEQVLRYSEEFQGVVMSYSNVHVLTKQPIIHPFFPYLSVDVQADVLLFRPEPGDLLVGKVNYISADLISLLVMELFNAAIGAASIRKGFRCKTEELVWVHKQHPRARIEIGTHVRFRVTSTKRAGRFYSIDGSLLEADTGVIEEPTEAAADTAQQLGSQPLDMQNGVAKKGKKRARAEAAAGHVNNIISPAAGPTTQPHSAAAGPSQDKSHHIRSSQATLNYPLADGMQGEEAQPKKKKKKAKLVEGDMVVNAVAAAAAAAAAEAEYPVSAEASIGGAGTVQGTELPPRKKKKEKRLSSEASAEAEGRAPAPAAAAAASHQLNTTQATAPGSQQAAPAGPKLKGPRPSSSLPQGPSAASAAPPAVAAAAAAAAAAASQSQPLPGKKKKKLKDIATAIAAPPASSTAEANNDQPPLAKKSKKSKVDSEGGQAAGALQPPQQAVAGSTHTHSNCLVSGVQGTGVVPDEEAARKAARKAAKRAARQLAESAAAGSFEATGSAQVNHHEAGGSGVQGQELQESGKKKKQKKQDKHQTAGLLHDS